MTPVSGARVFSALLVLAALCLAGEITGVVRGKVRGKRSDIKRLRVYVRGGDGLGGEEGVVDKRTGKYEVRGLAPGSGRIFLKRNNFDVARQTVAIGAGQATTLKTIRITGKVLPSPDPTVDCTKAKLVDGNGKPVPGVQLRWSSQWMDGGMASDEDGIVRLHGVRRGRDVYRPPPRRHVPLRDRHRRRPDPGARARGEGRERDNARDRASRVAGPGSSADP